MHSYVVITPARNEERHMAGILRSMEAQTLRPLRWVIVNDGSTDATGRLIDEAAARHDWITAVHRADRGFRKSGEGVMEAFYAGYDHVAGLSWDFLVKFDTDLTFPERYFEDCFHKFDADPKLGIGGGTICSEQAGVLVREAEGDPVFHVRGATKIYRRACWEAIGGLIRATGWDTMDEVKANMVGWTTLTFPDIRLAHHRFTGRADGNWRNWFKNGRANYIVGYHPLFMLLKCCKRLLDRPVFVQSLGLFAGFFSSYLGRVARVEDRELIRYLRDQQMRRLLGRQSIWR